LLEFRGVSKAFGGTQALLDVSFDVSAGTIHALVGENGAGKSTLIKILGGVFSSDSGTLRFEGRPLRFQSTHESQQAGISVIYQEFNLLPDLTVAENVFIGREPRRWGLLDGSAMRRETDRLLSQLAVELDPMAIVGDLSVGQRQMVEIAKALNVRANLIVMDEPTAALSERETEKLFGIIRTLKEQGKTILFVSHRLPEIFAVCECVTVLRDGRFVATHGIGEVDEGAIVRLMVGRDIKGFFSKEAAFTDEVSLRVEGLGVPATLRDVSFQARRGEIIGVAGLLGSGRTELLEALYGLLPLEQGEVYLDGRRIHAGGPREAIARGIGYLTEDRKSAGIFPGLSVLHNLTMAILKQLARLRGLLLSNAGERAVFREYASRLRIRYERATQRIEFLSGGNQQKVLLGRALSAECRLLLLCDPTRGVDVGAKAEIHKLMNELAHRGVTLLMSSSDLPELIRMSDSCLVMHQGRLVAHLRGEEIRENTVMSYATGQVVVGAGG